MTFHLLGEIPRSEGYVVHEIFFTLVAWRLQLWKRLFSDHTTLPDQPPFQILPRSPIQTGLAMNAGDRGNGAPQSP